MHMYRQKGIEGIGEGGKEDVIIRVNTKRVWQQREQGSKERIGRKWVREKRYICGKMTIPLEITDWL